MVITNKPILNGFPVFALLFISIISYFCNNKFTYVPYFSNNQDNYALNQ
ncbi:hypothetical protein FHT21_002800 [Pedobacter sp. SG908]|nr:hypothetical protein [Pedobacter sp. SG908]